MQVVTWYMRLFALLIAQPTQDTKSVKHMYEELLIIFLLLMTKGVYFDHIYILSSEVKIPPTIHS